MIKTIQLVGLTIWWTEGTKVRRDKRWKTASSYSVEVANTNPKILALFLDFMESIGVKRNQFKVQIQIHQGDDQVLLENFWLDQLKITKSRLEKTIIRPTGHKPGKSKGTCKVRLHSKELYLKLEDMLPLIGA